VATPESPDDVVAVIDIAREHGLRVAPQGTGHGALPRASLEGSVLADMSRMNAVEIDPSTAGRACRRARSGNTWSARPPSTGWRVFRERRPTSA
jgi:FAD/FMN-containing dehydrogenase